MYGICTNKYDLVEHNIHFGKFHGALIQNANIVENN